MAQSATPDAAARRRATAHRITRNARELALSHGVDGFTMDQLAERAGLSRRTLFNYFPGKYDALLGGGPSLDDEAIAVFRDGGPTGDLLEDVLVLADHVLEAREPTAEDAALGRRTLMSCPSLITHACARMDEAVTEFVDHLRARVGPGLDRRACHTLLATLVALGHLAIDDYATQGGSEPEVTPAVLLRQRVDDLRRLLT